MPNLVCSLGRGEPIRAREGSGVADGSGAVHILTHSAAAEAAFAVGPSWLDATWVVAPR